jgi:hypothetical protein
MAMVMGIIGAGVTITGTIVTGTGIGGIIAIGTGTTGIIGTIATGKSVGATSPQYLSA